ncbi:MAG: flavin reductase family protein [Spirochaetales bacterium]|nr:flavin reductase family protein [Spirochaetales bacterium]
MSKVQWKPGNMVYPVPAVMVSCGNAEEGFNIITVAWTGTICTNPPMVYISVRPERHSYDIIRRNGDFVINLTTRELAEATDWCGVRSGRDFDKFREMNLTALPATKVKAPLIEESPVNIECRVTEIRELGSHHMFLAEVLAVNVSDEYLDGKTGTFDMSATGLISYIHGKYYGSTAPLGKFGFSVQKTEKERPKPRREAEEENPAGGISASAGRSRKPRWTAKEKKGTGRKKNRKS